MQRSSQYINKLFEGSTYWAFKDDLFNALVYDGKNTYLDNFVTHDELASLHPNLPYALRALIEWQTTIDSDGLVDGLLAQETKKLTADNCIEFTNSDDEFITLTQVTDVDIARSRTDRALLYGRRVHTRSAEVENVAVRYVISAKSSEHIVLKSELETKYPGWEHRFRVAKEIGIRMEDLVAHVFSVEHYSTAPVNINGFNFD